MRKVRAWGGKKGEEIDGGRELRRSGSLGKKRGSVESMGSKRIKRTVVVDHSSVVQHRK